MTTSERQKVMDKVVKLIGEGKTNTFAVKSAGIDIKTLWNWRQRGKNDDTQGQQYSNFSKSYTHACELRRESLYDRLNDSGLEDWRATEAYLKLDLKREEGRKGETPTDDMSPLSDEEKATVEKI